MSFQERLKNRRLKRGLTQEQLALLTGFSQGMISQYESGARQPSVKVVFILASALQTPAAFLFGTEKDWK